MKKKKYLIITYFIVPAIISLLMFAFTVGAHAIAIEESIALLKLQKSSQVLLVTNNCASSSTVKINALEKKGTKWIKIGKSLNGVIGRHGFADLGNKREGDGKSPSGIFPLGEAFGYRESIKSKIPYRQVLSDDLWVDDVNAIDYNRRVKKNATQAKSYEIMRRNDDLYKYGIVIEYNTNPVIKGHGSAIFLHIWRGENMPTAGCVAVSEDNILRILGWLDPLANPLIIMGTEQIIERLFQ